METSLSKRFETLVKKLIDNKDKAYRLASIIKHFNRDVQIQLGRDIYCQMTASYEDQLMLLRKILSVLTNDKNTFDTNICNGILSVDVINNGYLINNNVHVNKLRSVNSVSTISINQYYVDNLKCLDEFSQESQDIISHCLNAFDEDYVLSDDIYDKIQNSIGSFNDSHSYEKLILEIHFKVMMHKLYFMWQKYLRYEHALKGFNEISNCNDTNVDSYHTKVSLVMFRLFDSVKNIDDYKFLFRKMESSMKEYTNVNILENTIND